MCPCWSNPGRWRERVDKVLVVDCEKRPRSNASASAGLDGRARTRRDGRAGQPRCIAAAADAVIYNDGISLVALRHPGARLAQILGRSGETMPANPLASLTLILYEYPFNESIRTMLRLEHLFDRLGTLMGRDAALDHHFALVTLFEIMDVASRADLKSDLLKELERHKAQLQSYRGLPGAEDQRLDQIIQH